MLRRVNLPRYSLAPVDRAGCSGTERSLGQIVLAFNPVPTGRIIRTSWRYWTSKKFLRMVDWTTMLTSWTMPFYRPRGEDRGARSGRKIRRRRRRRCDEFATDRPFACPDKAACRLMDQARLRAGEGWHDLHREDQACSCSTTRAPAKPLARCFPPIYPPKITSDRPFICKRLQFATAMSPLRRQIATI